MKVSSIRAPRSPRGQQSPPRFSLELSSPRQPCQELYRIGVGCDPSRMAVDGLRRRLPLQCPSCEMRATSPVSSSDLRSERMPGQHPDTAVMSLESGCSISWAGLGGLATDGSEVAVGIPLERYNG